MKKLVALSILLASLSGCGMMVGKDRDAWFVYCSAFQERSSGVKTASGTDFHSASSSAQGVEAFASLASTVEQLSVLAAQSQGVPVRSNVVEKGVQK